MGVARNQHVLVLLAGFLKRLEQRFDLVHCLLDFGAGVEFQIHQDLIVAGTSCVHLLPDIPEPTRQHQLDLRVDVLHVILNVKLSLAG